MSDFFTSLIRTYVPMGVGAVVAWLVAHGIHLDPNTVTGGVAFLTAVFSGLYYLVVRLLERKFPQFGWLLGNKTAPKYDQYER